MIKPHNQSWTEYFDENFNAHIKYANGWEKINGREALFNLKRAHQYLRLSMESRIEEIIKKHCR